MAWETMCWCEEPEESLVQKVSPFYHEPVVALCQTGEEGVSLGRRNFSIDI